MRRVTRRPGPFLEGRTVLLRPMELADLNGGYADWLNDYQVTRYLETGAFPSTRASLVRYFEQVARQPDNVMLAIIDRASGAHIGNIKLGPIHALHRRADMGVLIGDKRHWGRGCGSEAVALILAYGFARLNLHKITLGVYADHAPAVAAYRRLGFVVEGRLREQLFRDGAYHDKYVMGILARDFRPLKPQGAAHARRRARLVPHAAG